MRTHSPSSVQFLEEGQPTANTPTPVPGVGCSALASHLPASYIRLLQKRGCTYLIFLFWLFASVVGVVSYGDVFGALDTHFEPVPGSPTARALAALSSTFPANSTVDTFAVRSPSCHFILS